MTDYTKDSKRKKDRTQDKEKNGEKRNKLKASWKVDIEPEIMTSLGENQQS